ncbi:hypothetical protein SLS55_004044 [Diplodia seriata]|uniref:Uncharacterized protein n=1 Tax=Diplodia seriata TaxID=420778 RepID=A0ABR3CIB8_9PEZI
MRLLHPFASLIMLANAAAGIETENGNGAPMSSSLPTPSANSLLPTPSSPTNMINDGDDDNNITTTTCLTPSAASNTTNLLRNGDFALALADGSSPWTITGTLALLPGKWPSYGIDSVPSTSSSSPRSPNDDNDDGTANAFYANVGAPSRREITLAQDFDDGGAGAGAGERKKLSFGIELRASRAKPPARVGCEYYYFESGGGGSEEVVRDLVDEQPVPVPAERGAWARRGAVFDGGGAGRGIGRQGVRCRIVVEEGDFGGNKDVTVYVRSVAVVRCD